MTSLKRFFIAMAVCAVAFAGILTGCSGTASSAGAAQLEDGTYIADFTTDNSMFHVNEALEGKATLTVKDGQATAHVVLPSKNIVNLYLGTAEEAKAASESTWLQPTEEEVTYKDGMTETVHAFDIPVPAIDEEFDCALIGTKGKWYDHKVKVSNPEPAQG